MARPSEDVAVRVTVSPTLTCAEVGLILTTSSSVPNKSQPPASAMITTAKRTHNVFIKTLNFEDFEFKLLIHSPDMINFEPYDSTKKSKTCFTLYLLYYKK